MFYNITSGIQSATTRVSANCVYTGCLIITFIVSFTSRNDWRKCSATSIFIGDVAFGASTNHGSNWHGIDLDKIENELEFIKEILVFHRSTSLKAKRHLNQNQTRDCTFSNGKLHFYFKSSEIVRTATSYFLSLLKVQNFFWTILCFISIYMKARKKCFVTRGSSKY